MTKNIENTIKIDKILEELYSLREKNEFLEKENEELRAKNTALKRDYEDFYEKEYLTRIDECNRLWGELFTIKHMSMFEFAAKYCKDEELEDAGRQFAKELLGGA